MPVKKRKRSQKQRDNLKKRWHAGCLLLSSTPHDCTVRAADVAVAAPEQSEMPAATAEITAAEKEASETPTPVAAATAAEATAPALPPSALEMRQQQLATSAHDRGLLNSLDDASERDLEAAFDGHMWRGENPLDAYINACRKENTERELRLFSSHRLCHRYIYCDAAGWSRASSETLNNC
jgi:hypothetical protein